MKKTAILLLLVLLIFTSGCGPVVLSFADTAGLLETETTPLLRAKPIPEPAFNTAHAVPDALVDGIIDLTNQERTNAGLPELSVDPALCSIAELRALDMAENNYFEHSSPTGETAFSLLHDYGIFYLAASENIAIGTVSCARIFEVWMTSASHRESIMSKNFHQIGVGIVEAADGQTYWVQVFSS